jgi:hypothetical protein
MKISLLLFLICSSFQLSAQIDTICFYVTAGNVTMVDGLPISLRSYSSNNEFVINSPIVVLEQNSTIYLRLINLDNVEHGLEIPGILSFGAVLPDDSTGLEVTLTNAGVFRYFDPSNFPYNSYIGLSGILHVKAVTDQTPYFYWDLSEHQISFHEEIISGNNPDLNTYDPKYFTVNGNSDMAIDMDPLAKIIGTVGNEFKLIIMNNGLSIHSIHFHGYHGTITSSSKSNLHIGWEKDTFPVYPNEYMVISIVPDKPGEYPIHDHNLVAVTGGGMYHAGMISTIVVTP